MHGRPSHYSQGKAVLFSAFSSFHIDELHTQGQDPHHARVVRGNNANFHGRFRYILMVRCLKYRFAYVQCSWPKDASNFQELTAAERAEYRKAGQELPPLTYVFPNSNLQA